VFTGDDILKLDTSQTRPDNRIYQLGETERQLLSAECRIDLKSFLLPIFLSPISFQHIRSLNVEGSDRK